jgi:predicted RNA-binding protein with PIN domain
MLVTVAFGVLWASVERVLTTPETQPSPYDRSDVSDPGATLPLTPEPDVWLIDGFNVLHAGVLKGRDREGWWKAPVQLRLVERVAYFERRDAELWVVFDAAHEHSERCVPPPELSRVQLVFAPSADDWLVRRVRQADAPERLAVVTGDRQVGGRVRHAGAHVVSPRTFLARCLRTEAAST